MAGFLDLIDDALGTHFNTPKYDPAKGREKFIKSIDTTAAQHKEGRSKVPNRAWKVGNNDAISYSPKLNGNPVLIRGKETNYVPASRFQDFLTQLKKAVGAGELDKEIKAALEGGSSQAFGTGKGRSSSKSGEGFPKHLRNDWDKLEAQQKRNLGIWWSKGKNPDQSDRAQVGDKPNAPYKPAK